MKLDTLLVTSTQEYASIRPVMLLVWRKIAGAQSLGLAVRKIAFILLLAFLLIAGMLHACMFPR